VKPGGRAFLNDADRSYRFDLRVATSLRRWINLCAPAEFCGFLVGQLVGQFAAGSRDISDVVPVQNADTALDGFAITTTDARWARCEAERRGLELIAVVHSHSQGRLELSQADIEGVEMSDLPWMVVAVPNSAFPDRLACVVHEAGSAKLVWTHPNLLASQLGNCICLSG
jgi:proteasome lid subunit RPN8/RPN11